ncbi:MAG: hypothetical protein JJU35_05805 [Balneolales bacterium]|nr:hypothetical protein [Balneolales bacterium]
MKKLLTGLVVVMLLLTAGLFAYVSSLNGDDIAKMLTDELGAGFQVEMADASVSLMRRSAEMSDISIRHIPSGHLLFRVASFRLKGLSLSGLLR